MALGRSILCFIVNFLDSRSLRSKYVSFMMKQKFIWGLSAAVLLFASCSSLEKSSVDEEMRFQGSFSCQPRSEENRLVKETLAEADVARVRCAKDSIDFEGQTLKFTRTLFQSLGCEGILGRIQFSEAAQLVSDKFEVQTAHCTLIRVNPSWVGEDSGHCMLNQLNLNTPYPLRKVYACQKYVPAFCKANRSFDVEADPLKDRKSREPFQRVVIHSASETLPTVCERYGNR